MATYVDLSGIKADSRWNDLQQKVRFACVKKASVIIDSATPTASAVAWATECLGNPVAKSEQIENYVIAANSGATLTAIFGATDAAIQANVNAAVDVLAV